MNFVCIVFSRQIWESVLILCHSFSQCLSVCLTLPVSLSISVSLSVPLGPNACNILRTKYLNSKKRSCNLQQTLIFCYRRCIYWLPAVRLLWDCLPLALTLRCLSLHSRDWRFDITAWNNERLAADQQQFPH